MGAAGTKEMLMIHFFSRTIYVLLRTSKLLATTTFCQQSRYKGRRLGCALAAFAVGLLLANPCAATPFEWSLTGSLNTGRVFHTATLLPSGKVLVAGGWDSNSVRVAMAELYDPATGSWSVTGSMNIPRIWHSATLLPNGLVLVAGGSSTAGSEVTAELYDPATGTWSFTGNLNMARAIHSSALLSNGKVLVAGGSGLKSAELYDPATGTWSTTGTLNEKHVAGLIPVPLTVLTSGKALIEGGIGGHSESTGIAELYDPDTGLWSLTGSLNTAREEQTATLLPNGMVLVAGGYNTDLTTIASAELYDPATSVWTATGSMVQDRNRHTATLLSNGLVLVAGGVGQFDGFLTEAELYDPTTGIWTVTGSMNDARADYPATLLPSGLVLVAAGGVPNAVNSAELYDPGIATATQVSGRGTIDGQGDQASFNFHASESGDRPSGSLSFSDPAAGISIAKARIRTLNFNGNSADLGGNARLGDGTRVTYSVSVTDNSSDGSTDTFSITLSNGYAAGGTLTSGDIKVQ